MKLCWKWFGLVLLLVLGVGSVMAQDKPIDNDVYIVSPDGMRLITDDVNDEGQYITTLLEVGGGSRPFAQVNEGEIRIPVSSWSPDGRRIAVDLYVNGQHNLAMVDPDTLKVQIVVENTPMPMMQFVSWSPDSQMLLIRENPNGIYLWDGVNGDLIQIVDQNAPITANYEDPWSPDSRFIVFGGQELRVYDVNRHTFSENFMEAYDDGDPNHSIGGGGMWSPDSQHLAMSVDSDIYLLDIRKGVFTWLADTATDYGPDLLSWSADGTEIYYDSYSSLDPDAEGLYRVTLADGKITPLVMAYGIFFFAPDREHFLMFNLEYRESRATTLAIGNAETGEMFPLDLDHTVEMTRLWSADSRYAFISVCKLNEDDYDIFQIDIKNQTVLRVTDDGNDPERTICEGLG